MLLLFGAVLGLVIGAATGGTSGAFIGLALGGGAGAALIAAVNNLIGKRLGPIEAKIEHIYKSLGDIHFRLKSLEDAREARVAQAAPAVEIAVEREAPVVAQPVPRPAPEPILQRAAVAAATPASANLDIELPALLPEVQAPVAGHLVNQAPALTLEPIEMAPHDARAEPPAAPPVAPPAPLTPPPVYARKEEVLSEPDAPGFIARLFEGNLVAKAGVVILFFGVGFLLKYAYDHSILPPWTRLLGVAVASAGLFYAGWRLLESRRLYAVILMGCGFGFLYLDVFFALKWYHYIDAAAGFGLFMVLGVATVLTAVRMDARALAVLGLLGAFLAPPLASTGSGSHVLLFSYYTLLNLFILGVSWFKAWRDLNLVGFGFTFLISTAWGARSYRPELFGSVEPFVVIFFLIYLAIPVLFATRQKPALRGLVDGTLVFGTPIACAFLQARVVEGMGEHALAWSAGLAGLLYGILGLAMRKREPMQLLGEAYIALATLLLTMTVFFALDAYPTFALWTLEGAAIIWIGLRQQRWLARLFGLLLQVGAALYFLGHYLQIERANPLFNDFVLGCALIACAAWISAWLMDRYREILGEGETLAGNLLLLWGWGWWFGGALHGLYHAVPVADFAPAMLLLATASLAAAEILGTWLPPAGWPALRRICALHLGFIAAAALWSSWQFDHPLSGLGVIAWPLAFGAHFWMLRNHQRDGLQAMEATRELLGWLALAALATWDAGWLIAHDQYLPAMLWALAAFIAGWLRYFLREREDAVLPISRAVLVWALLVWGAAGGDWLSVNHSGAALVFLLLAAAAGSAILFEAFGSLGRWADLRRAGGLLLLAMVAALAWLYDKHVHPLTAEGAWAWPLAFAVAWATLWRQEQGACALLPKAQHVALFWLLCLILLWEVDARLHLAQAALQWQRAAWGAIPAVLVLLTVPLARRGTWPWREHTALYREVALAPLLVLMAGWSLYANLVDPGAPVPAMHLPLLNPLDVTQMLVLFGIWTWAKQVVQDWDAADMLKPALGALVFIWVNGVALRAIHYYADVPYELHAQLVSILTQSVLSLLWTSCALVLMTWASRRGFRPAWTVGAVLLGVVVIKLVTNDLGNSGTVARIVSFLGVGAMLLLIGYIAPLPPGQALKEGDGHG